jgi:hypothetical protein
LKSFTPARNAAEEPRGLDADGNSDAIRRYCFGRHSILLEPKVFPKELKPIGGFETQATMGRQTRPIAESHIRTEFIEASRARPVFDGGHERPSNATEA